MSNNPAIQAISDDDLYKFTMQQGYLQLYPDATATSEFTNRRLGDHFTPKAVDALREEINYWETIRLSKEEEDFFRNLGFFKPWYIEWLKNFRYNRDEVELKLDDGRLNMIIRGFLHRQTGYEVKLMGATSQKYFEYCDTDWNHHGQVELAYEKTMRLADNDCVFTDFGTRRRRSFQSQDTFVRTATLSPAYKSGHFVGTSNVFLAMKYGIKAIGTVAHEWFMAHSALMGLRYANRYGMDAWTKVYEGKLGTLLTDTYGTDSCLKDFSYQRARMWDGVRHDSGDPFIYTDKMFNHYGSLNIDPNSKHIVFSNALDVQGSIDLRRYCDKKVLPRFGMGTHLTNDYRKASDPAVVSKALNMVIKLRSVNGIQVVKLSDDADKATGEKDAVRVAKYIHLGIPLDA